MTPILWRHNRQFATVARNALGLYGLYCGYYLVSFLVTPYLARMLGPAGFGRFAVFQGLAMSAALLIEFGFSFSASAALQRSPDRSAASRVVVEVMAAKGTLAACASLLLLFVAWRIPAFNSRALFGACLLAVISQGFSPSWIYQGYGRLIGYSAFDMAVKVAFALAVFLVVHAPEDLRLAAFLWALSSAVSTMGGMIWIARGFDWTIVPTSSAVARRLREGASLFGFRIASNLQAAANPVIVSLFEIGTGLGAYAGCDKIAKNLSGTLYPAIEALYPYLANRAREAGTANRWRSELTVATMATAGAALSIAVYASAPMLVRVFLGPAYRDATALLQILAPLPLLTAFSHSLGVHYMVPQGFGRAYFCIVVIVLLLHAALATLLTQAYGARGMCYAQLFTPATTILMMLIAIRRAGVPFTLMTRTAAEG